MKQLILTINYDYVKCVYVHYWYHLLVYFHYSIRNIISHKSPTTTVHMSHSLVAAQLSTMHNFLSGRWQLVIMMMRNVLFVISLVLTIPNSYCQVFSNTIPEQVNGGSPIVSGIENSNDVKIVCEVFFNDTPLITEWRLITEGVSSLLLFHANGTGNNELNDVSLQFSVTGVSSGSQTTQANLTIINFTSSLDTSVIECFSSINTLGNFTLQLIGK